MKRIILMLVACLALFEWQVRAFDLTDKPSSISTYFNELDDKKDMDAINDPPHNNDGFWSGSFVPFGLGPVDITGFNEDIVANGVGAMTSSITAEADLAGFCLLSSDWKFNAGDPAITVGLPANGVIASSGIPGLTYQIPSASSPYAVNNSLQISQTGIANAETLSLNTPGTYTDLYLLAFSGGGNATMDIEVVFSDNTTQIFTGISVPDWYQTGLPIEIQGFGRGVTNTNNVENPSNNPKLFRIDLDISIANESKNISSINFTRTNTVGIFNLMAVSGNHINLACSPPSNLAVTNITGTGAILSWNAEPNATNGYIWNVYNAGDVPGTDPPVDSGTTASGTTTATATGLTAVNSYNAYVQSDCGSGLQSIAAGLVAFATPPLPNDDLTNAIALIVDATCTGSPYTNTGATVETGETAGSCWFSGDGVQKSIWFVFTAPASGSVIVTTDFPGGTHTDTQLTAFLPPTTPGNLTTLPPEIGCNDDAIPGSNLLSTMPLSDLIPGNTYYIQVDGYDGATGTFCIEVQNACQAPTDLAVSNIGATTADLSWNAEANATNGYVWSVFNFGDDPVTATPVASGVTAPGVLTANISGLSNNIDYDAYIQSDCETTNGQSDLVGPVAFSTLCGTFSPPYTDDFSFFPPNCWEVANGGLPATGPTDPGLSHWVQDEFANAGADQAARMQFFQSGNQDWLISPVFDLSTGSYELAYNVAVTDSGNTNPSAMGSDDQVQVLISTDNGATWNNLLTYDAGNTPSNTGDLEIIDLSTYTSATTKIAFWRSDGAIDNPGVYDFYVDNFGIRGCPTPTGLAVSNISSTTATFSWNNPVGATTSYIWRVFDYNADPLTALPVATGTTVSGTTTANASGLIASTVYDIYVQSDCGTTNGQSPLAGPVTFVTACAPSGHFSENFNAMPYFQDLPSCWSSITPVGTNVFSDMGSGYMGIYNNGVANAEVLLITPPLADLSNGTHNRLRFRAESSDPGLVSLEVGILSEVDDPATFTPVQSIALTGSYQQFTVPFTAPTSDSFVAFRATYASTATTNVYVYIDDVFWEANCSAPTSLAISNINETSATLSWNAEAGATNGYVWSLFHSGDDPVTAVPVATGNTSPGTTTATASGLAFGVVYDAYVRSDCGTTNGQSSFAIPIPFSTTCPAFMTAPWTDDVEAHTATTTLTDSKCWTTIPDSTGNNYDWNVSASNTPSVFSGPDAANSGIKFFYIDDSDGNLGDVAELYTPLVDISALTAPALEFYYHMYGSEIGELHVDIYDGTTWVNDILVISGQQQTDGSDPWLSKSIDLSGYSGTIRARFRAVAVRVVTSRGDISLDDISFINGCFPPTGLSISNILGDSATLSWNAAPNATTGYVWSVFNSGDDPVTAVPVATGTTASGMTTANVSGLVASTNYDVYVQSDCGATYGQSGLGGPVMFDTACAPYGDFSEDFDVSFPDLPSCWGWINPIGTQVFANPGFDRAQMSNNFGGANAELFLITPPLVDLSNGTHNRIRFGAESSDPGLVSLEVGTMADADDPATFTPVQSIALTGSYQQYIVPFTAPTSDSFVAFRATYASTATSNVDVYIDDVVWEAIPPCPQPQPGSLAVSNISATTSQLSWNAVGAASSGYVWSVFNSGDDPITATAVATGTTVSGTTTATATGLAPSTAYEFYVHANCGMTNGQSTLSGPVAFTTLVPCPAPTNLTVINITPTTADLSWDAMPDATVGYLWSVYHSGHVPGTDPPVDNGFASPGTNTVTATGLTQGNFYDAYVQSICAGIGQSTLAGPVTFLPSPPNDNLANAIALTMDATCTGNAYTNMGATVEAGEFPGSCWLDGPSLVSTVWFTFTAPLSGGVVVTTDIAGPTDTDTQLSLFLPPTTPGDLTTLVEVACDDDGGTVVSLNSIMTLGGLTPGNTYYIQVDGYGSTGLAGDFGDFCIEVRSIDYVYANGAWLPSDPSGVSTSADDILVVDATASLSADTQVRNLTIDSLAILNVEGVLSPNGTIENNGELVFISNGTVLGQLDYMINSSITGSGDETVQRHIPARRAYRALSSGVTTLTNINDNWQEGVNNIGTNYPADNQNPNHGFGTHITGSTTGVSGFDATQTGAPSMYDFNNSTQAWTAIDNTESSMLSAGDAKLLFVRGDRSINLGANPPAAPTSTILRATGSLHVGDYSDNTLNNTVGGFSFVGNPYQAIVDMNDALSNSTNLNTSYYYVWDPNLSSNGAYALVNLPGGSSVPPSSEANEFLQPGQAVFVSTLAAEAAIFRVEELDKNVGAIPTNVFKPQATTSISLELYEAGNFVGNGPVCDGFLVNFDPGGNNAVDSNDAAKPMNFDENVGLSNGTSLLIMENRDMPTPSDILPIYNNNYRHTDYVYQIQVSGLSKMTPVLTDDYLGAQTPLQDGLNTINFSVDAGIEASIASDRFSIVFQKRLSTEDVLADNFELYPNPVTGNSFFIHAPGTAGQDMQVSLYDLLGRKVYGKILKAGADNRVEVSVKGLQAGAYIVKMGLDGKTFVQKFIVE